MLRNNPSKHFRRVNKSGFCTIGTTYIKRPDRFSSFSSCDWHFWVSRLKNGSCSLFFFSSFFFLSCRDAQMLPQPFRNGFGDLVVWLSILFLVKKFLSPLLPFSLKAIRNSGKFVSGRYLHILVALFCVCAVRPPLSVCRSEVFFHF